MSDTAAQVRSKVNDDEKARAQKDHYELLEMDRQKGKSLKEKDKKVILKV